MAATRSVERRASGRTDNGLVTKMSAVVRRRLQETDVAWLCTLRPDGSPHMTPIWFWFQDGTWWVSIAARSVKVVNITTDPRVSIALPDGDSPVVAEGAAIVHRSGFPFEVVSALAGKYGGWDVTDEGPQGPRVLLEVPVSRWLLTGTAQ